MKQKTENYFNYLGLNRPSFKRIWLWLLLFITCVSISKQVNSQVYAVSLSNNIRDIQEDIFGLNGTNTIVAGSSWGELQNIQPHPFCKLQLGNIRYPGGQVSNWWNWKRGWFLNPLEYPAGITYHPAYDNTNPFNLDNGLDAFKANSDMLNANPIWSVNTLTSNKEYQTAFMFAARAKGFTVKNIELGVEYYLEYDNYKEKYPSPITYIKDMDDWTGYLKNLNVNSIHPFGNTKLAIVGSNSNSKDPGRRREWLNCILDDMQANPSLAQNIDAITIHDYFGAGSIHFNGLSNLMSPDDAKCMINQAYTTTQDLYDNEFLDIANKTGKEIWMTEYNLYDRTVYSVHATWAHGLTIALKSLRYLEQPLVTKLCMHTMTGDGGWASFFSDANGLTGPGMAPFAPPSSCSTSITHELSATGNAFQLLSYAIKNSTKAQKLNFNNSGTLSNCNGLPNYPDIYGWQFDALDAERFIILNLTDVSRNIDMSNNVITAIGQPQMLTYYPYNGSASGAIQGDALVSSIAPCFLTSELDPNVNISNFTIPPFGMVLITASKNAIIAKPTAAEICAGSQTTVMVYNWNFNPMLQNFHSTFGLLTPVANCPGLFNFDPNGNTGTAILTFECLFPNATTTTQITVQPRPTISISPLNGTYCPNNGLPITLTATTSLTNPIVLWGPNWGLNNPSGKVVTATPQFNTTYNAYIFEGVCFAESNDAVITVPRIEITNAGKKFVICNNENDPLNIEPQIDLSNCVGCTLSYLWSTSVATSSISVVPAAINTYTVTVTATNATCTSTVTATYTLALNECCGVAATNNVVLSPNVTLGVLLRVDETELSDAVTLICPTCVASTPTSVTINDNGPGLGTIYINGRFVVAGQDVIFKNCNIRLGENAEIYVNNNHNVKFNNCDIRNACNTMWQGITAESNNAGIFFEGSNINHNRVEGAIRAVDLSNDANFEIAYTDFVNNFQNIRINNYAKTLRGRLHVNTNMQGYIYGCTFNSTPGSMLPPHNNQTSLDDIQLANVPHILLGYADNNTNNAHFTNTFAGADVGIRSTNSELQVVNSNFNNMRASNIFPANNTAIRATSAYDCNDRTLTVGGNFANNVDRCTFVNSGFGIYTAGEMNVDVQNNIFGTAAVAGSGNTTGDIFISLPGLKNVNISSNNRFYQFNHAVQINTSPQYATNIFIDNNIFDTYTRPVSEDQYFGTAVLVINKGASVQKPKRNFSITNNTIINPRIGIAVLNHNYIHIGFDPVNNITSANTIQYNLTTAPGDYTAGMLLQNCGNARVVGNTISNSNTLTGITNFRGIDAELCADGRFNCNTITRMSYGFRFMGNCDKTLLRSNSMTLYDEGIHLDGATLPDQYQVNDNTGDNEPMDNAWNDTPNLSGTPTDRVVGTSGGLINWYHQTVGGVFNPLDGNTTSLIVKSVPDAAATPPVACGDFSSRHNRDAEYGRTVGDSLQFDEYANENIWLAKWNAFTNMKVDSSIMYQGNSADVYYQEFYNDVAQTNIGAFAEVSELAADTTNIASAQTVNAAIVDTNNIEYYKKTVNSIYINTYANNLSPGTMDSSVLDNISALNFYEAGDAIYVAASMLDKEIHPQYVAMRKAKPLAPLIKLEDEYSLVPNPANIFFTIRGNNKNIKEVTVIDTEGKIIKNYQSPLPMQFAIAEIANGTYQIKIVDTFGHATIRKLTIVRQ